MAVVKWSYQGFWKPVLTNLLHVTVFVFSVQISLTKNTLSYFGSGIVVLYGIVWYCMVFYSIAWYCWPQLYNQRLHHLKPSFIQYVVAEKLFIYEDYVSLQKDKLQTKHNEQFYKCTLKKSTYHRSPIFLQTQFKKS